MSIDNRRQHKESEIGDGDFASIANWLDVFKPIFFVRQ